MGEDKKRKKFPLGVVLGISIVLAVIVVANIIFYFFISEYRSFQSMIM